MKLTPRQLAAIDYIGRHRKSPAKIGARTPCSIRMYNRLAALHLVMPRRQGVMLTYMGEREFTKMHPRSKYKIK